MLLSRAAMAAASFLLPVQANTVFLPAFVSTTTRVMSGHIGCEPVTMRATSPNGMLMLWSCSAPRSISTASASFSAWAMRDCESSTAAATAANSVRSPTIPRSKSEVNRSRVAQ